MEIETSINTDYARKFDIHNVNWVGGAPDYTNLFLLHTKALWNETLRRRGHVFLNEVYDSLGLTRTPYGAVMGWLSPAVIGFQVTNVSDECWRIEFNVHPFPIFEEI